jgi:hypothetical protein
MFTHGLNFGKALFINYPRASSTVTACTLSGFADYLTQTVAEGREYELRRGLRITGTTCIMNLVFVPFWFTWAVPKIWARP